MDLQPLDFEKPILELERRLQELKAHSREHNVDLGSEVEAIEAKLRDTRRQVYGNLSAWQRVQIARHVQRPFALDYVERCFTGWTELHGDRHFADDKAMPSGLAMLDSQRCVVITHQKGRDTKENVMRNFGCAHPEGYRKALRLMRLAQKFDAGNFVDRHTGRVSRNRFGRTAHLRSDCGQSARDDEFADTHYCRGDR